MTHQSGRPRLTRGLVLSALVATTLVGAAGLTPAADAATKKRTTPTRPATSTPASTAAVVTPAAAPTRNITDGCITTFDPSVDYFPEKSRIVEAKGLTIRYEKSYKVVIVAVPYRGAKSGYTYVLNQCGAPAPKLDGALAKAVLVQVPITTAAIMSTVVAPDFDVLGIADKVIAVDEPDYYSTPSIVSRIKAGKIKRVGGGGDTNVEQLLTLKPSVVVTYSVSGGPGDGIDKLSSTGLTPVVEAGYMEETPLGRAEWLKLIGALTNRDAVADARFGQWRTDYQALAAKASAAKIKPVVISGNMYQGTWYMPGGKSFAAQYIRDAGGAYPWSSDSSTGSIPLDFETVLEKGFDATVWINAGYLWDTQRDALKEDSRYTKLAAYSAGNVWGNDARVNATGGSDYYETAVARPDLVLADLVAVLHPELVPNHQSTWFRHLPRS